MADWYVSSAAYAAIAAFVPSGVYTLGQICKPTAPALKAQWVFRCTTAGTASTEPAWPTANNSTITTGGATFTNVTGQSTYAWSAAAGDLPTVANSAGIVRFVAGDRIFVSSDHSETQTTTSDYGTGSSTSGSFVGGQILSVNRAGSAPPVAADLLPGATVTVSGANSLNIDTLFPLYHYGMNYISTGSAIAGIIFNGTRAAWLDTCQLYLNNTTGNQRIQSGGSPASVVLYNSTVRFGATTQGFGTGSSTPLELLWLNTPGAIAGATIPAILFNMLSTSCTYITARGVDFSAITGTLMGNGGTSETKALFDSCRIASGVTRYSLTAPSGVSNAHDLVELVNCYDGTNFISESHQPAGDVTTEFTITLSGGAQDNVGVYSHKMVSNTNIDKYVNPLTGFWMDVNYATVGGAKTASVEIVSSASLNNDEISLILEYQGTLGSSVASFVTSLPATVLTTASAVTTSSATWNSLPATPVRQRLSVTFTPQVVGRVRAQVRLGKPSTTVYVNPQVTIT